MHQDYNGTRLDIDANNDNWSDYDLLADDNYSDNCDYDFDDDNLPSGGDDNSVSNDYETTYAQGSSLSWGRIGS